MPLRVRNTSLSPHPPLLSVFSFPPRPVLCMQLIHICMPATPTPTPPNEEEQFLGDNADAAYAAAPRDYAYANSCVRPLSECVMRDPSPPFADAVGATHYIPEKGKGGRGEEEAADGDGCGVMKSPFGKFCLRRRRRRRPKRNFFWDTSRRRRDDRGGGKKEDASSHLRRKRRPQKYSKCRDGIG